MAKLSDLTALGAVPAGSDEFYIRDISEAASAESKKIIFDDLVKLRSTITSEFQSSTAATGNQSYSGAGFAPTTVIIFATDNSNNVSASWGFGDDSGTGEMALFATLLQDAAPQWDVTDTQIVKAADNGNSQIATLVSLDADGITLGWTRGGSGQSCDLQILYLR